MESTAAAQVSELVLQILLPLLAPLAVWLGHRLVKVVEQKTGVDVPEKEEEMMRLWILQGIAYAEERARQAVKAKASKVTGPEKLEIATDFVMDLIKKYSLDKKAEKWVRDQVQKRIEANVAEAKPDRDPA